MPLTPLGKVVVATLLALVAALGACGSGDGGESVQAPAGGEAQAAPTDEADAPRAGARRLRPRPARAFEDRPKIFYDGCYIQFDERRSPRCSYGDPSSATTVVLFADSHGEPYFAALERLANRRGWHLIALAKSFCPPALVRQRHPRRSGAFSDCHEWRRNSLERMRDHANPDLVVLGGSTAVTITGRGGRVLRGQRARRAFVRGYAAMLDRIHGMGAEVALATDAPQAPFKVPECIMENRSNLRACNFRAPRNGGPKAIARAAVRRARDATLVDTVRRICGKRRCRAVVDDVIAYRDKGHLTATYGAAVTPTFARTLPPIG